MTAISFITPIVCSNIKANNTHTAQKTQNGIQGHMQNFKFWSLSGMRERDRDLSVKVYEKKESDILTTIIINLKMQVGFCVTLTPPPPPPIIPKSAVFYEDFWGVIRYD